MVVKKSYGDDWAIYDSLGVYRYALYRKHKGGGGICTFIGLNPSTATEREDDNTVRRCRNYTIDWGYGGFYMLNIFALRSTDPKRLQSVDDPVGLSNDEYILQLSKKSDKVVMAWGTHGEFLDRGIYVYNILKTNDIDVFCLGQTKNGHPRHPLYLKKELTPVRFIERGEYKNAMENKD